MKLAVCIYGHIRSWVHCRESFLKHLSPYNPDIFIHTYNSDDYRRKEVKRYTLEEVRTMFKEVNPKKLEVEQDDEKWHEEIRKESCKYDHFKGKGNDPHWVYCIFRKICKVRDLMREYEKETGTVYTHVMYTRPNIEIVKLNIENRNDGTLYIGQIASSEPDDMCIFGSRGMTEMFCKRMDALDLIYKIRVPGMLEHFPFYPKWIFRFCSIYYLKKHKFWDSSRIQIKENKNY